MICTTIQKRNLQEIIQALESPLVGMAEIRLDRCSLDLEEIETLFSETDLPLVATCRCNGEDGISSQEAERRLIAAIRAGAAYVDVEIEAPAMMSKRIRRAAREYGTRLIRSYHDFEGTDSPFALQAIVDKCLHLGAEVVKIVTTANTFQDCERVLSLYDHFPTEALVAFCMGDLGQDSRLECLRRGAPFTYAAFSEEEAAAPGQWPVGQMHNAVYGNFHFIGCGANASGPISMPCSKSFAQRAIIAAALARGQSLLRGYTSCGDNDSAIGVARALGAKVAIDGDTLRIQGIGTEDGIPKFTAGEIHTGESGLLTRLMIPVIAHIASGPVHVTGEKTLLNRPLPDAREIMEAFGVELVPDNPADDNSPVKIPLTVEGRLQPGNKEISGSGGSQLISGLLFALPLCGEPTELVVTNPKSLPYLFITLDVLKKFFIRMECSMEGGEEFIQQQDWALCEKVSFDIRGGGRLRGASIDLEADWSSAAPMLVAGAIFGKAELRGLDSKSLQADLSIMDILTEAGVSISEYEEERVIHVQRAPLRGFDVDANNCPDLFPMVAVLAAFCEGRSRIRGAGRLAAKESNRAGAIVQMLTSFGVPASVKGDTLTVHGLSLEHRLLTNNLLCGGHFTSHHDHRMAMAIMIAALGAKDPVTIDDTICLSKSFPDFIQTLRTLTGKPTI